MSENAKKAMPQSLRWVYYLSPKHGYAVLKHQRLAMDGRVVASYSNDSFQAIPGSQIVLAGMVKISILENYDHSLGSYHYEILSIPACTRDMSVVKVSMEPIPKEQFVLNRNEVAPGARIYGTAAPPLQHKDGSVKTNTFTMPATSGD